MILGDGDSSLVERREAVGMLKETLGLMQRVMGKFHPETQRVQEELEHQEDLSSTLAA